MTTFSDLVTEARIQAIADGASEDYAKAIATYLGLAVSESAKLVNNALLVVSIRLDSESLVVMPGIGVEQLRQDRESAAAKGIVGNVSNAPTESQPSASAPDGDTVANNRQLRRFHATAELNATRIALDAGDISEAIIQHLAALVDAKVTVTLEIQAAVPNGVPDNVVRTVSENARTLKFIAANFEES